MEADRTLPDVRRPVPAAGQHQLLARVEPDGVYTSGVTRVLEQTRAAVHAPDPRSLVRTGRGNHGQPQSAHTDLPDPVLVGPVVPLDWVDGHPGLGSLQARHDLVGLVLQLVGVGFEPSAGGEHLAGGGAGHAEPGAGLAVNFIHGSDTFSVSVLCQCVQFLL